MKSLKLVLKREYYLMIISGIKKEEYRRDTSYWRSRLLNKDGSVRQFSQVIFYLGYAKDRPMMTFEILEIIKGQGKKEWGAPSNEETFIIKLGKRI